MRIYILPFFLLFIVAAACTHRVESSNQVNLAPVEIKPIHITLDVNVKVQVDKDLNDFFGDLDQ